MEGWFGAANSDTLTSGIASTPNPDVPASKLGVPWPSPDVVGSNPDVP